MSRERFTSVTPGTLSWQIMLVVFAAAVVARLLNIAILPLEPEIILGEDAWAYWNNATALAQHGVFADAPNAGRMPGYFILLAGLHWLFGPSLFWVLAVQGLLDAVICVLVAMIGARLSVSVGLVAGLLAAVWPNLIIMSASVLTDSFFLLPFTAMLYAVLRYLESGSARWAAWTGLFLGAAIMVRAVAQYLPLAMLPLVIALPWWRWRDLRRGVAAGLAFLVAMALPLTPWLHRNVTQFDSMALTSQGGVHLHFWVLPSIYSITRGVTTTQAQEDINANFDTYSAARGLVMDEMNVFARSRVMTDFYLAELSRIPARDIAQAWGYGMGLNFFFPALAIDPRMRALSHPSFASTSHLDLISRVTSYLQEASPVYLAAAAMGLVFAVVASGLQLYGFILLARISGWIALVAAGGVLYFLLISGPIVSPKYRLPFEPGLIILQAMALVDLWPWLKRLTGGKI